MYPYISIDTTAAWKKLRFILSVRTNFHMTDSLSIAVQALASRILMSVSVDETMLPRQVNLPTSFRELPFTVEMSPVWLKHIFRLVRIDIEDNACSDLFHTIKLSFGLYGSICQKRCIIGVVSVGNCFAGYLLLLVFVSLRPFSLILSIDILNT